MAGSLLFGGLALLLLGWNLRQGSIGTMGPALALLVPLSIALDVSAPEVPGFGFFSAAPAVVLAAALLADVGPAAASLLLLVSLAVRSLVRGSDLTTRLRELLGDLVPGLVCLAIVGLLESHSDLAAALVAAAAYPLLGFFLPGALAAELPEEPGRRWAAAHSQLLLPFAGLGLAGVGVAWLCSGNPWGALVMAPCLYALQRLAGRGLASPSQHEQRHARRAADRAREAEEQTRQALEQARFQAGRQAKQLQAIEELIRALTRCEDLQSTLEELVCQVSRAVSADSVVVFLPEEGRLLPRAYRSELAEQLESAALIDLQEPCVEECWQHSATVHISGAGLHKRLLGQEKSSLALLLPEVGVLYLGRRAEGGFEQSDRYLAGMLASQAAVAIAAAGRRQREKEALDMHRRAHQKLDRWVERITVLLEGTRSLVSTLDAVRLGEELEQLLRRLVPHRAGALSLDGKLARTWCADGALDEAAVAVLDETVRHNLVPLLLEDVARSRFSAPQFGCRSLLAVPLMREGLAVGSLVLSSDGLKGFDREHQNLLSLAALLAAVCYQATARHQELVEAHRLLSQSQAQLVQASKMAAMGQFAAGVAHELNTPLASVLLFIEGAEMLLQRSPDRAAGKLDAARKAVEQAASIVAKLMVYCRSQGAPPQAVRLDSVVVDTMQLVGGQLSRQGIEVATELGNPPPVLGVPSELQQVLTNLLVNACDAGARRLVIRTRQLDGEVELEVDDAGPGVPAEVADRIFEPFFTTKPVGRGTGLGLSVSHEIVARHGGSLELGASKLGGACFRMRFHSTDKGAKSRPTDSNAPMPMN